MGYVICYWFAVHDYDLDGGNFSEKLQIWLPPSTYLDEGPLCFELVVDGLQDKMELLP